jgi:hypothetical protein
MYVHRCLVPGSLEAPRGALGAWQLWILGQTSLAASFRAATLPGDRVIRVMGEKKPMAKWIGHVETRCIEK